MADLKEEIKEIVEIVALVPEPLKVMCFEMLLKNALSKRESPPKPPPPAHTDQKQESKVAKAADAEEKLAEAIDLGASRSLGAQPKVGGGSDINMSDLHMKTKRFMATGGVTLEHINNVFYKEGDNFELLITDFGATSMSDGQMRIAMFQALHQALLDGEFTTTVEAVREECRMRKCLDAPNFTKNFKNNASIFDFGEWSKDVTDLRLSDEGRKALAEVVKKLS
ncbi:hypothetical protein [Pelomonas sp. Root1237]|uniref:hypothetical protein n=1 Tax=Pelomonas sp. Root1237 TaxID=1736434 RepID=UPI00070170B0|nr:hypothetical protein [Pelomonas sp. Root1237]KQV91911.1 hypothetical protein ASC91_04665 [Pelomonas sp. Root1237]